MSLKGKFGDELRALRLQAGKSMGDVARLLGVSVTFISDVERGRRGPLSPDNVTKAAEFLGVDPKPLLTKAAKEKGSIKLSAVNATPMHLAVGAGLARRWADLTPEQLQQIGKVLGEEDEESGKDG